VSEAFAAITDELIREQLITHEIREARWTARRGAWAYFAGPGQRWGRPPRFARSWCGAVGLDAQGRPTPA